jgi:hypothetical protein
VSTAARIAAFLAALAFVFAGAALAGAALDPRGDEPVADRRGGHEGDDMTAMNTAHGAEEAETIRGLAVAEDQLRVVVEDPELRRGRTERLRFRVVDEAGRTVRDFDVEHEKRMHLILARHDLTGFQHLHPAQQPDGSWETGVRIEEAGSYRLFADFSHDGAARTLGADLRVDGPADLRPLPPARTEAVSDGGYDVRLDAPAVRPGREATLRFTITKDGQPVKVEQYLGADGHLVALRDGDMAFLHVHPGDDGFAVTFPSEGRYRLFLQFQHEGRVHTVAFTREAR